MKKKVLFFVMTVVASFLLMPTVFAQSAPVYDTPANMDGNPVELFFANGTPITISERTDGKEGALITWEGGSQTVGPNANIFGASHEDDTRYETTSITMNGGTVRNIIGGGLHKSNVGTTKIVVNGGTVVAIQGGGAASFSNTACHRPWHSGEPKNSPNRVDVANVTINHVDGTVYTVYGGGEGISYTGKTTVNIVDGSFTYVIAGGSNGYTGEATMNIRGGTIGTLQSVNRGSMEKAMMEVSGGTITNAYVGGDASDSDVTGTIDTASMNITAGTVKKVAVGSNGGQATSAKDIASLTYKEGTVEAIDESTFKEENLVATIEITISANGVNETIEVPKGSVLTDAEIAELKNLDLKALGIEGFTFGGYYADEAMTKEYDFTKPFTANTTIYLKLVQEVAVEDENVEKVKNPDTADLNMGVILVTMLVSSLGLGYAVKRIKSN